MEITDNKEKQRFQMPLGTEFAYVDYRYFEGSLVLMHTFVPPEGRGKGISARLAERALQYAADNGLKVVAYCPFMADYISKHPEYEPLLNKRFRRKIKE